MDSELSGNTEEIELSRRNENCYEISGGALDVDLSGSLSLHSSSRPIKSSVLGPKTYSCLPERVSHTLIQEVKIGNTYTRIKHFKLSTSSRTSTTCPL